MDVKQFIWGLFTKRIIHYSEPLSGGTLTRVKLVLAMFIFELVFVGEKKKKTYKELIFHA